MFHEHSQWLESLCLVRAILFFSMADEEIELWNLEVTSGCSLSAYPGHNRCRNCSCSSWAPDQLKPAASTGWFENWGHNQFGKNEGLCHRVTPDPFAFLIDRQGVKFISPFAETMASRDVIFRDGHMGPNGHLQVPRRCPEHFWWSELLSPFQNMPYWILRPNCEGVHWYMWSRYSSHTLRVEALLLASDNTCENLTPSVSIDLHREA